ncbi:MAG: hypothetical protein O7G86_16270, partial [Gammaproteobacteria bacterium]|nr:hypothetical protein [Gammaproteobacteria bacterium]
MKRISCLWILLGLGACSQPPEVRFFPVDHYPERLSAWGVVVRRDDALVFTSRARPYELNSPLFSDYALKLRTLWLPAGTTAEFNVDEAFDFPTGTIVTKTFFYPRIIDPGGTSLAAWQGWSGDVEAVNFTDYEIIETRLLVRQADHWDALAYVWQGDDAYLKITGAIRQFDIELDQQVAKLNYIVPTRNECAACHATNHSTGEIQPIGLKARHLNRTYPGEEYNQLTVWQNENLLIGLPSLDEVKNTARMGDIAASVDRRARGYLDINCGHCHNDQGAADMSGLLLDANTTSVHQLGYCKAPIAAGTGSGGRLYSI